MVIVSRFGRCAELPATGRFRSVRAAALMAGCLMAPASGVAHAQPAIDPLAAEELYKRGRELVASGDWTAGCAKFEASYKLNPAAVTMINIAKCHEHEGKLTLAVSDYRAALKLNERTLGEERQKQLAEIAKAGIAEITPKLGKLTIVIASPPAGLVVVRDQVELPAAVLGEAIPVDPGTHEIEVSAPGFTAERRTVDVKEAEAVSVEISLVPAKAPETSPKPAETQKAPAAQPAPKNPIVNDKNTKEFGDGAPTWAWVAAGAGVVMIAGGIAFRLDQSAAESTLIEKCGEELKCPANQGYDPSADNARKNRDFGLFVGLSAAGALSLGAAIYGFTRGGAKQDRAKTNSMIVPMIAGPVKGALIQGVF